MPNLGGMEIAGIVALFILLFGARKLPELGSSVGASIKNFKKGMAEAQQEDSEDPEHVTQSSTQSSSKNDAG